MKTIFVDAVFCLVSEHGVVNELMIQLLDTYPNDKIVLTGANDEQAKKFGLDVLPYTVFSLSHNPEKTDPDYYRTLLETHGLTLEDVVYFEHSKDACDSARSVGINTYFYDDTEADLVALKAYLDSNL